MASSSACGASTVLLDVKIVVEPNVSAPRCTSLYGLIQGECLGERRETLLSIQNKLFCMSIFWNPVFDAFNRPGLKAYLSSSFQEHHSADWKGTGNAGQKIANMVVIPNPTTLKIRQLNFAFRNLSKQIVQ